MKAIGKPARSASLAESVSYTPGKTIDSVLVENCLNASDGPSVEPPIALLRCAQFAA